MIWRFYIISWYTILYHDISIYIVYRTSLQGRATPTLKIKMSNYSMPVGITLLNSIFFEYNAVTSDEWLCPLIWLNMQLLSRCNADSNTAVTLLEQSQVYLCYKLKTKQTSILVLKNKDPNNKSTETRDEWLYFCSGRKSLLFGIESNIL